MTGRIDNLRPVRHTAAKRPRQTAECRTRGSDVRAEPDHVDVRVLVFRDMSSDQTVKERIRAAMQQRELGDTARARSTMESLLPLAKSSSTFDWLFYAHAFADVQEDVTEELRWDQTALEALEQLSEAEAEAEQVHGGVAGLLPSLHLNLADVHRRLGDETRAQHHYAEGSKHLEALDQGDYGRSIREAFAQFAKG
jgi:hypothetical protein